MRKPLGYWPRTIAKLRPKRRKNNTAIRKKRIHQLESLEPRQLLTVDVVPFEPVLDGYVLAGTQSGDPPVEDEYLGASSESLSSSDPYESVLVFDVSSISNIGIEEQITRAELTLEPTWESESGIELGVAMVENNSSLNWAENVTWDTKPTAAELNSLLLDSVNAEQNEVLRLDVTEAVRRVAQRGDMDLDGSLNVAADVAAFELAVKDPDAYTAQYGFSPVEVSHRGDADGDGQISVSDLDGFLAWHGYLAGDFNFDTLVDMVDYSIYLNSSEQSGPFTYTEGDASLDGAVNNDDVAILGGAFGDPAPAPAEAELALWLFLPGNPATTEEVTLASSRNLAAEIQLPELIVTFNDAPQMSPQDYWQYLGQDVTDESNVGVAVVDLIENTSDSDEDALAGIAIVSAQSNDGVLQYRLTAGGAWLDLPVVSETSALVLPADENARIRFAPGSGFAGSDAISLAFRAWDQTDGSAAGDLVDTSDAGGAGAFSLLTDTLSFALTPAVGSESASTFADGLQDYSDVAMNESGGFVLVWQGDGPLGPGIYGELYDAEGELQTPFGHAEPGPFRIAPETGFPHEVSMASDGSFAVTWASADSLYVRRYEPGGRPRLTYFQTGVDWGANPDPHVAIAEDGAFALTWVEFDEFDEDVTGEKAYIRFFDANGSPQTSTAEIHWHDPQYSYPSGTQVSDTGAAIVALPDGGFLVAYERNGRVLSRAYDPAGQVIGGNWIAGEQEFKTGVSDPIENPDSFKPEEDLDEVGSNPSISVDSSGGYVVAWQSQENDSLESGSWIKMRRYDENYTAVGEVEIISAPETYFATAPVVAVTADGAAGIAWQTNSELWDEPGITLAWYNSGNELLVGQSRPASGTIPSGGWRRPSLASSSGGQVVVSWTGEWLAEGADPGDAGNIWAQRYTLPQSPSPNTAMDFRNRLVKTYGAAGDGSLIIAGEGSELNLTGDGRYAFYRPYVVTPNTLLSFEFESAQEGLVHGIGLDIDLTDDVSAGGQVRFDIYGSEAGEDGGVALTPYDPGEPTTGMVTIPVGDYFTGAVSFLTLANSDGVASSSESVFRNIQLFEADPVEDAIDLGQSAFVNYRYSFNDYQLLSDDTTLLVSAGVHGGALPYEYLVTPDTVLAFDFAAPSEGYWHAIGIDNDTTADTTDPTLFLIYGTTSSYLIFNNSFDGAYDGSSPGRQHIEIPVGTVYQGLSSYLTFSQRNGQSFFSNIRLYEQGGLEFDISAGGTIEFLQSPGASLSQTFALEGPLDTAILNEGLENDYSASEFIDWRILGNSNPAVATATIDESTHELTIKAHPARHGVTTIDVVATHPVDFKRARATLVVEVTPPLGVIDFGLAEDTGYNESDRITADTVVTGSIIGEISAGESLDVEFSYDGGTTVGGTISFTELTDTNRQFTFDPFDNGATLNAGQEFTLSYRLMHKDSEDEPIMTGVWNAFSFTPMSTDPWVEGFSVLRNLADPADPYATPSAYHPTVTGVVSGDFSSLADGRVEIEFNHKTDNKEITDDEPDGLVTIDINDILSDNANRRFTYDFSALLTSPTAYDVPIEYRATLYDDTETVVYADANWSDQYLFNLESAPTQLDWSVSSFGLENGTNESSDPTLTGSVSGGSPDEPAFVVVQFAIEDWDGSSYTYTEIGDTVTDQDNHFTFTPDSSLLTKDEVIYVVARVRQWNFDLGDYLQHDWENATGYTSFTFTDDPEANGLTLTLANDTDEGENEDPLGGVVTADASIQGALSEEFTNRENVRIEFYHDIGQGAPTSGDAEHGVVYTDANGDFVYTPTGLIYGNPNDANTIYWRISRWDPDEGIEGQFVPDDWCASEDALEFTLVAPESPSIIELALDADDGVVDANGYAVVSEPTLTGRLDTPGEIAFVEVAFDHEADGEIDGYATTNAFGQFSYTPSLGYVDFDDFTLESYDYQDGQSPSPAPISEIIDGGTGLRLQGNAWKAIQLTSPYDITPNTILEFDFSSPVGGEGEIQGIAFEYDLDFDTPTTYAYGIQVYGDQQLWDTQESYDPAEGVVHYSVPVGQLANFNGETFNYLVFVNDHDVASPTSESVFSNVRLFEAGAAAPTANDLTIVAFPLSEDKNLGRNRVDWDTGSATYLDAFGQTYFDPSAGNGPTSNRHVTFDLIAPTYTTAVIEDLTLVGDLGEVDSYGDPLVTDPTLTGRVMRDGSPAPYATVRFDHDEDGEIDGQTTADAEGFFSYTPALGYVDFDDFTLESYDYQDGQAPSPAPISDTVDGGAGLHLQGNAWKAIQLDTPYDVTPNTILEFDFFSPAGGEGEIQGITFEYDLNFDTATTDTYGIQVHGSQILWDTQETYDPEDGAVRYSIPIGQIANFDGETFNYLVFVNDHDVASPTSESVFSKVRLFEAGASGVDAAGNTVYFPAGILAETVTVAAATWEWDAVNRSYVDGDSVSTVFTLAADDNDPAAVQSISLASDTDLSSGDTANSLLTGAVENDGDLAGIAVSIEIARASDSAVVATGTAFTDESGAFYFQPDALPFDEDFEVSARASEWDLRTKSYLEDPATASVLAFTLVEPTTNQPAEIVDSSLQLVNITGDPGDETTPPTTSDPTITGRIVNEVFLAGVIVEFDDDADDSNGVLGQAVVDERGIFTFTPEDLPIGGSAITVYARARERDPLTNAPLVGSWTTSSLDFLFVAPTFFVAEVTDLDPVNPTGSFDPNNPTNPIVTDRALTGQIARDESDDKPLEGVVIELDDDTSAANGVLATATTDASGVFVIDLDELTAGAHTVYARAREVDGVGMVNRGTEASLDFTLEDPLNVSTVSQAYDANDQPEITIQVDGFGELGGVVIELDQNGDGVADRAVVTDAAGQAVVIPEDLTPGYSTVGARIAAPTGNVENEWNTVSFFYTTDPDSATTSIEDFDDFEGALSDARSNYESQVAAFDSTYENTINSAQSTYETIVEDAGATRSGLVESATSAYQQNLRDAESAYQTAIAAAASTFETELAASGLDTSSFPLGDFNWPDSPAGGAFSIPADSRQPRPPKAPTYDGYWLGNLASAADVAAYAAYDSSIAAAAKDFKSAWESAEADYKQAIATARRQYELQLDEGLSQAYDTALSLTSEAPDLNEAFADRAEAIQQAHDAYVPRLAVIEAEYEAAKAAIEEQKTYMVGEIPSWGHPQYAPADAVAGVLGDAVQEREDELDQELFDDLEDLVDSEAINNRWEEYNQDLYDLYMEYDSQALNVQRKYYQELSKLDRDRQQKLASAREVRDLAIHAADADLEKAIAEYKAWDKEFSAHLFEQESIVKANAQQALDESIAEAERTRSEAEADASHAYTIAVATAEGKLKIALANNRVNALEAAAENQDNPYLTYELELARNERDFTVAANALLLTLSTTLADADRTEANKLAEAAEALSKAEAVATTKQTKREAAAWKTYVLGERDLELTRRYDRADNWRQQRDEFTQADTTYDIGVADVEHEFVLAETDAVVPFTLVWDKWGWTSLLQPWGLPEDKPDAFYAYYQLDYETDVELAEAGRDYFDVTAWSPTSPSGYLGFFEYGEDWLAAQLSLTIEKTELALAAADQKSIAAEAYGHENHQIEVDYLTEYSELRVTYDFAIALSNKEFATEVVAAAELYDTKTADAAKQRTLTVAPAEATFENGIASLSSELEKKDAEAERSLDVALAADYVEAVEAWDLWDSDEANRTAWANYVHALAVAELQYVSQESAARIGYVTKLGEAEVVWTAMVTQADLQLIQSQANAAHTRSKDIASAVSDHATEITNAEAIRTYEVTASVATHDTEVAELNQEYHDLVTTADETEQQSINAADAEYLTKKAEALYNFGLTVNELNYQYELYKAHDDFADQVAALNTVLDPDGTYTVPPIPPEAIDGSEEDTAQRLAQQDYYETVGGYNYDNYPYGGYYEGTLPPIRDQQIAAAELTRAQTVAGGRHDWAVAQAEQDVALAGWIAGADVAYAEAIKESTVSLATAWAGADETYDKTLASAIKTQTLAYTMAATQLDNAYTLADADYFTAIDQAEAAYARKATAERGEYEVALFTEHAAAMQDQYDADSSDINAYRLAVADADILWASMVAGAANSYISRINGASAALTAQLNQADIQLVSNDGISALAYTNEVANAEWQYDNGLAAADKKRHIDAQKAIAEHAGDSVKADAAYDQEIANASRDYDVDLADADLDWALTVAGLNYAEIVDPNIDNTAPKQTADDDRDDAYDEALEDYNVAAALAGVTQATALGAALVQRATSLGDVLVTYTNEINIAESQLTTGVTNADVDLFTDLASHVSLHSNLVAQAERNFVSRVGAADVADVEALGQAMVLRTATVALAEADYQMALADQRADAAEALAAANPSIDGYGDQALQARAYSNWIEELTSGSTTVDSLISDWQSDFTESEVNAGELTALASTIPVDAENVFDAGVRTLIRLVLEDGYVGSATDLTLVGSYLSPIEPNWFDDFWFNANGYVMADGVASEEEIASLAEGATLIETEPNEALADLVNLVFLELPPGGGMQSGSSPLTPGELADLTAAADLAPLYDEIGDPADPGDFTIEDLLEQITAATTVGVPAADYDGLLSNLTSTATSGDFVAYITNLAQADADWLRAEAVSLATWANEEQRAVVDLTSQVGELSQDTTFESATASAAFSVALSGQYSAYFSSGAGADKTLSVERAQADKDHAVGYAVADYNYYVAMDAAETQAEEDDAYWDMVDAQDLADTTRRDALADADYTWTAAIADATSTLEIATAGSGHTLNVTLAGADETYLVGEAAALETLDVAFAAALTDRWDAEVATDNAYATAVATADAQWWTAEYAAEAAVLADAADDADGWGIELPWTEYRAARASTLAAWWAGQQGDYLTWVADTNDEHTAYQDTVSAAYRTGAGRVAAANKNYVVQVAAAAETNVVTQSGLEKNYTTAMAPERADYTKDVAAARRDLIKEDINQTQYDLAVLNALADLNGAEFANGTLKRVGIALADFVFDLAEASADTERTEEQADAERDYALIEIGANYDRERAIAALDRDYWIDDVTGYRDAFNDLANDPAGYNGANPWANYDYADAVADYFRVAGDPGATPDPILGQAQAEYDRRVAEADAREEEEIDGADAGYNVENAPADATQQQAAEAAALANGYDLTDPAEFPINPASTAAGALAVLTAAAAVTQADAEDDAHEELANDGHTTAGAPAELAPDAAGENQVPAGEGVGTPEGFDHEESNNAAQLGTVPTTPPDDAEGLTEREAERLIKLLNERVYGNANSAGYSVDSNGLISQLGAGGRIPVVPGIQDDLSIITKIHYYRNRDGSPSYGYPGPGRWSHTVIGSFEDARSGRVSATVRFVPQDAKATQFAAAHKAEGDRRISHLEHALDLAQLAKGVYEKQDHTALEAAGWKAIDERSNEANGFRAQLFYNATTRNYVIAFAGTDPSSGADWWTNLVQGLGFLASQYEEAYTTTNQWIAKHNIPKDKLSLTAHSLGGGIASFVSIVRGFPAVTFNASGVSEATVARYGKSVSQGDKLIEAFRVRGEILTTTQDSKLSLWDPTSKKRAIGALMPDSTGRTVWLPATSKLAVSRHAIDEVIRGLEKLLAETRSDLQRPPRPSRDY